MKAKKNTRQRSEQMQQVSAGLRDVLGMTQWRKEHPKATWAEIEAAIDERMNQLRAQVIQDVVQMGETCTGYLGHPFKKRHLETEKDSLRWFANTGGLV